MKCSLDISNFPEEILVFPLLLSPTFMHCSLTKGLLVSPCYSLELCVTEYVQINQNLRSRNDGLNSSRSSSQRGLKIGPHCSNSYVPLTRLCFLFSHFKTEFLAIIIQAHQEKIQLWRSQKSTFGVHFWTLKAGSSGFLPCLLWLVLVHCHWYSPEGWTVW